MQSADACHRFSESIPRLPGEERKNRDQGDHDKHPVLDFETQKSEMLDEKVHCNAPNFWAG
jgi:hypothetical protein